MTATVGSLLAQATKLLAGKTESPRLDAEILMAFSLKTERTKLTISPGKELSDFDASAFLALVARRAEKVPVAYLTGRKPFWEDDFYVDNRVLIPRPDTETIVEAAKAFARTRPQPIAVLDICTGSGCIGISVYKGFSGTLTLADISPDALAVAKINMAHILPQASPVFFVESDLFSHITGTFDLITANPPYLTDDEYSGLTDSPARHEPKQALTSGPQGFEISALILADTARYLKPGGRLFMELGWHGAADAPIVPAPGLLYRGTLKDLAGIERCAVWEKN